MQTVKLRMLRNVQSARERNAVRKILNKIALSYIKSFSATSLFRKIKLPNALRWGVFFVCFKNETALCEIF